ncbi:MAG: choice-of-anchor D domain-containing protein, partial [Cytophagales bacterium]
MASTLRTGVKETKTINLSNTGGSTLSFNSRLEFVASPTQQGASVRMQSNHHPNNSGVVLQPSDSTTAFPAAAGDFTLRASSAFPLTCMAVNPTNGLIYAQQNQGIEFYSYDPQSDKWTTLQPSPINSGNNGGATFLDGRVYTSYTTGLSKIGVYTVATNSWSSITSPFATGNITNDGTFVYATAGTLFSRYNPSTNLWTTLPAPPFSFSAWGGIAFHKGFIYGHQGNGGTSFARYSIAAQTWTLLPPVPNGAVLGSAIDPVTETYYAYGSYFGNNLYSFSLTSNTWSVTTIPLFNVNDGGLEYVKLPGLNGIYFLEGEAGSRVGRFETKSALNWLTVTPNSGSVATGSALTVDAQFNAQGLKGGLYTANIKIQSNDPTKPELTLPVSLTVTDAPDIVADTTRLDFDQVYTGQLKSLNLVIANEGTVVLSVTRLGFNSTLFSTTASPFSLAPKTSITIPITFKPIVGGVFESQ